MWLAVGFFAGPDGNGQRIFFRWKGAIVFAAHVSAIWIVGFVEVQNNRAILDVVRGKVNVPSGFVGFVAGRGVGEWKEEIILVIPFLNN